MNFVSSKARVKGHLEGENIVLGPTTIGAKSIIGRSVIAGYPARKSIRTFSFPKREFNIEKYDSVSKGAKIGTNCIIRSGTVIYEDVMIADEVEIGHFVLIREGSVVGEKSLIGSSTQLDGTVKIGRNVSIQSNVYLPHLCVIEDNVFLAPNVVFTNDPYPKSRRLVGIVVGKDAVVGANACIVAKVKIGEGAVVGAGSVVTKTVAANTVVVGTPARFYMTREEYDKKRTKWESS